MLYIVSSTNTLVVVKLIALYLTMQCKATEIIIPQFYHQLSRPLFSTRVSAGFPSPAEDYIEGRIDLNKDLIKHPFTTFYVRVVGIRWNP